MEFDKRKEGNERYLVIENIKFDESDYHIQMLLNNQIKGLLPIKIRNINNEKELLYDITAMSALNNIFERRLMKREELIKFVLAIKQLEDKLKEYLLSGDNVKYDMNHIYYMAKQDQYYFCYCPIEVEDFSLQMKELFNQILDYVNYNDRETVALAYGMQEIASRDDFAIEELLDFALKTKEEVVPIDIDEENEYDCEETIEDEKQRESFVDKIKKFLCKEKTKEESYEDSIYIEETEINENFNFDTDNLSDEEATVLLTSNAADYIILKSTNREPMIVVAPEKFPYVIGKSKRSCDYRISSSVVSRVHARINSELGEFTIEDLNSTNGTFVNDERLKPHETKQIEKGDIVRLADIEFNVE